MTKKQNKKITDKDLLNYKKANKLLKDMKDQKIYFPCIEGKNLNLVKKLKFYTKNQLNILHDYDLFNNNKDSKFNLKIWDKMIDLNSDCLEILELNKFALVQQKTDMDQLKHNNGYRSRYDRLNIYIQNVKFRSDYNGNHGSYNAYYIKNNKLNKITVKSLHCFSNKDRLYHKHGGNYSFTHDLSCDISRIVSSKYDFFNYTEI